MKTIHFIISSFSLCFLMMITSCTKDFCEDAACLNEGICIDGGCDCPESYTGTYCEDQATPDEIRIRTIKVTRFPGMNNGMSWDESDGPDLYFRLNEGQMPLAQPYSAVENADASQQYYFFIELILMQNVLNEHSLQLKDYDKEDDDDLLGEVKFTPYHSTNGFPSTIILDNGGPVAFTIEVDYIYRDTD